MPNVTLTLYEGRAYDLAARALRDMMAQATFGDVIVYSDRRLEVDGVRWIETSAAPKEHATHMVTQWSGRDVKTSHFIQAQWDSGILDAARWRDEFLQYDFIGAPWSSTGQQVGCGGFALFSRRLIEHLFASGKYPNHGNDALLGYRYRPMLEAEGFKWAPAADARDFAFERYGDRSAFAYHGIFNMARVLPREEFLARADLDGGYMRSKVEWRESAQIAGVPA